MSDMEVMHEPAAAESAAAAPPAARTRPLSSALPRNLFRSMLAAAREFQPGSVVQRTPDSATGAAMSAALHLDAVDEELPCGELVQTAVATMGPRRDEAQHLVDSRKNTLALKLCARDYGRTARAVFEQRWPQLQLLQLEVEGGDIPQLKADSLVHLELEERGGGASNVAQVHEMLAGVRHSVQVLRLKTRHDIAALNCEFPRLQELELENVEQEAFTTTLPAAPAPLFLLAPMLQDLHLKNLASLYELRGAALPRGLRALTVTRCPQLQLLDVGGLRELRSLMLMMNERLKHVRRLSQLAALEDLSVQNSVLELDAEDVQGLKLVNLNATRVAWMSEEALRCLDVEKLVTASIPFSELSAAARAFRARTRAFLSFDGVRHRHGLHGMRDTHSQFEPNSLEDLQFEADGLRAHALAMNTYYEERRARVRAAQADDERRTRARTVISLLSSDDDEEEEEVVVR